MKKLVFAIILALASGARAQIVLTHDTNGYLSGYTNLQTRGFVSASGYFGDASMMGGIPGDQQATNQVLQAEIGKNSTNITTLGTYLGSYSNSVAATLDGKLETNSGMASTNPTYAGAMYVTPGSWPSSAGYDPYFPMAQSGAVYSILSPPPYSMESQPFHYYDLMSDGSQVASGYQINGTTGAASFAWGAAAVDVEGNISSPTVSYLSNGIIAALGATVSAGSNASNFTLAIGQQCTNAIGTYIGEYSNSVATLLCGKLETNSALAALSTNDGSQLKNLQATSVTGQVADSAFADVAAYSYYVEYVTNLVTFATNAQNAEVSSISSNSVYAASTAYATNSGTAVSVSGQVAGSQVTGIPSDQIATNLNQAATNMAQTALIQANSLGVNLASNEIVTFGQSVTNDIIATSNILSVATATAQNTANAALPSSSTNGMFVGATNASKLYTDTSASTLSNNIIAYASGASNTLANATVGAGRITSQINPTNLPPALTNSTYTLTNGSSLVTLSLTTNGAATITGATNIQVMPPNGNTNAEFSLIVGNAGTSFGVGTNANQMFISLSNELVFATNIFSVGGTDVGTLANIDYSGTYRGPNFYVTGPAGAADFQARTAGAPLLLELQNNYVVATGSAVNSNLYVGMSIIATNGLIAADVNTNSIIHTSTNLVFITGTEQTNTIGFNSNGTFSISGATNVQIMPPGGNSNSVFTIQSGLAGTSLSVGANANQIFLGTNNTVFGGTNTSSASGNLYSGAFNTSFNYGTIYAGFVSSANGKVVLQGYNGSIYANLASISTTSPMVVSNGFASYRTNAPTTSDIGPNGFLDWQTNNTYQHSVNNSGSLTNFQQALIVGATPAGSVFVSDGTNLVAQSNFIVSANGSLVQQVLPSGMTNYYGTVSLTQGATNTAWNVNGNIWTTTSANSVGATNTTSTTPIFAVAMPPLGSNTVVNVTLELSGCVTNNSTFAYLYYSNVLVATSYAGPQTTASAFNFEQPFAVRNQGSPALQEGNNYSGQGQTGAGNTPPKNATFNSAQNFIMSGSFISMPAGNTNTCGGFTITINNR